MKMQSIKELPDGSAVFQLQDISDEEMQALVQRGLIELLKDAVGQEKFKSYCSENGYMLIPTEYAIARKDTLLNSCAKPTQVGELIVGYDYDGKIHVSGEIVPEVISLVSEAVKRLTEYKQVLTSTED